MSGYAVANLDDIDELDDGREPYRPVRHHFGITAFGATAWTARDAGDRIINEHDEADDGQEELYLVLRGHAAFELDGKRLDARTGTFVSVPAGVRRTAFAEEPGTTILAVGGLPGQAYEPVGWEIWAPLRPLYEAGKYAEAADRGRELIEANPQYARTRRRIRTSIRFAASPPSASWSAIELGGLPVTRWDKLPTWPLWACLGSDPGHGSAGRVAPTRRVVGGQQTRPAVF